jgi:hypothetical protein
MEEMTGTGGLLPGLARPTGRRGFLKRTGGLAAAAAVGGGLAACSEPFGTEDGRIELNFGTDSGVLNYLYVFEQLRAGFHAAVVGNAAFAATFSPGEQLVLRDIALHEAAHRDFLGAAIPALGFSRIPTLGMKLTSITLSDRTQVLNAARDFADLSSGAYNGAVHYLQSAQLVAMICKTASVEARHASAIRDLIAPKTSQFAPDTFDDVLDPVGALTSAATYLDALFTVSNAR